ncbi:MAG: HAD hydrolase family protein [Pyrodictiaceae archaeon]
MLSSRGKYVRTTSELVYRLRDLLGGRRPLMLCTDVDGVLTVSRASYELDLKVVGLLRELREHGLPICLASATAYPTVRCLIRYLGLSRLAIAEDGCIIDVYGKRLHLTSRSAREVVKEVAKRFNLTESWQNQYRHHDFALELVESRVLREEAQLVASRVKEYVERNYSWLRTVYTGFAIHIHPVECSKENALRKLVSILGFDLSRVIAVGDSNVDAGILEVAGVGIAVGDADDEAKRAADIVVELPASKATIVVLESLIKYMREASSSPTSP